MQDLSNIKSAISLFVCLLVYLFIYFDFSPAPLDQWFLTLGSPGVLGLQSPEAFTTSYAGWGFWDLQSQNTWITQG